MEKSVDLKKIVMKHWKLWSFISIGLLIVACSKDNGNENLPPANNNFDRGAMLLNWADNIIDSCCNVKEDEDWKKFICI